MKLLSFGLSLALLPLLGSSVLAQGQLWIVDDDGGAGVDFNDIQAAIDAAAGGDTILVRSGNYGTTASDGKALVVAEDSGQSVSMSSIAVRNLQGGQRVVLRGISANNWRLEANNGPVWVESVSGGSIPFFACIGGSGSVDMLTISSCADVVITRSTFNGGHTYDAGYDAIHAADSNLYLFETIAEGGTPTGSSQGAGGDGVDITQCTLFASGCRFVGGCGAFGSACSSGGDGGAGLRRTGGTPPDLLECVLAGGYEGCAAEYPLCPYCGQPGADVVGGYTLIAGYARDYAIASPGTGGQTTTLVYTGKAGDLVFSLVALSQDSLFLPELAGTLVLPIPPILISHGPAGGTGALTVAVPLPSLPPGTEAFTVYAQAAAVSAVGAAVLAAPSQLTIR
jgi:hypothetical protein